jgi:hypothetical protein
MVEPCDVLLVATVEDFAAVRQGLRQSHFSVDGFMKRFGIKTTKDGFEKLSTSDFSDDLLSNLTRLFILGDSVKKDSLISGGFSSEACAALERLDLVRTFKYAPGHYTSTVRLQPCAGLVLASDRAIRIGATSLALPSDSVYNPLDRSAWQYMRFLPTDKCERFLEMCAGCGIAALYAAKNFSRHAWACDINARASHFMDFNMKLNDIQNVTVATGDLFDPLRGLQFDCIVAHPPYIPALNNPFVYSAGGEIGDELLLRIIREMPGYLAPGGFFYARGTVTETECVSFEKRIRQTLGECSDLFDVVVVTISEMSPLEFCNSMRREQRYSAVEKDQQLSLYARRGVERLLDCVFLLHRCSETRPGRTVREPLVDTRKLKSLYETSVGSAVYDLAGQDKSSARQMEALSKGAVHANQVIQIGADRDAAGAD